MGDVNATIIDVGAPENDIFLANGVVLLDVFSPVKPRQVHHFSATISEMCHYTFLAGTHLESFKTQYVAFHLDKRHVAIQFAYAVKSAAVHMLIWIILEQVTVGLDAEFIAQQLLAVRANARQELDVLIENVQLCLQFTVYSLQRASATMMS